MKRDALSIEDTSSRPSMLSGNLLLKTAIFATGLAGMVAEYSMSTLASYLLGNEVVQWTLTISIMLFAMGVGSRLSKYIKGALLEKFILIELLLSILCAVSALSVYLIATVVDWVAPFIYLVSFSIGLLIGLEIPMAARLNEIFEDLRVNISSIMEKDYYGALLGGLLFAFVALPLLGLTFTPIVLGVVNLLVAAALFWQQRSRINFRRSFQSAFIAVPLLLGMLFWKAEPIVLYAEQQKYVDRVIYEEQTPYQKIVITQWKNDYWLYLNGNTQFSSYDEERYHEPLVHPAMGVAAATTDILILGGGDGLAAREVLKYNQVQSITLVDLDPAITDLGQEHPIFTRLNEDALNNERLQVINADAYTYLKECDRLFDVIIIDLPDPKTITLARLYSREFYQLASRQLSKGGVIVTQATSPFFSPRAFMSIWRTMEQAELTTTGYHNHIPTLGEWGWVLGMKSDRIESDQLQQRLRALDFSQVNTRFLDSAMMDAMLSFGKGDLNGMSEVEVNHEMELVLFEYYRNGNWDFY